MRIFLSYRRDDAAGHAGRLYDALAARFGAERVFIDVDDISLGTAFGDAISDAVASCDVLIALIGRGWLHATDANENQRLMDPEDHLRREIEAALARGVLVIPATVQGAAIPSRQDLPSTLAPLADRQGIELRDTAWHDDVDRLIRRLGVADDERPEHAPAADRSAPHDDHRRRLPRRAVLAAMAVAALALASALVLSQDDSGDKDDSDDRGFSTEERRLLATIPPATRPSCDPTDADEGVQAQLDCNVGSTLFVSYLLFDDVLTAEGWYTKLRLREDIEAARGTCTPGDFRGETDYRVAGVTAGRYFCRFDADRSPLLVAQVRRKRLGLEVRSDRKGRAGAEGLLSLWECCIRLRP